MQRLAPPSLPAATPRRPAGLVIGGVLASLLACEVSDIGSPCNHGAADPQETLVVTFPALACSDLVCIYADRKQPPADACQDHADCNVDGAGEMPFRCDDGHCAIAPQHVLAHSMCSTFCAEDADCAQPDPDTTCKTGFTCVAPQDLGPYCCQKMCVCLDDLDLAAAQQRDQQCEAGTHPSCCQGPDQPAACGPP